jgi:hypothetical protein
MTMSSLDTIPTDDNIYAFVQHSYAGTGGYLSGDYLIKHDKENSINRRKKSVYYKNYVRGILDSLITPVFTDTAIRATNNELFSAFLDNVDNRGNDMQSFSKLVLKYARMHGVCFTLMDNFSYEMPDTKQEALETRSYPYLMFKTADLVGHVETDDFGRLGEVSFIDDVMVDGGVETIIYRLWTGEYTVKYIVKSGCKHEIEPRFEHGLGFLPVIATYVDIDSDVLPQPPIYDICRMNYTIYNMDSEQRNLERLTAFPMLTIQSRDSNANVNIGADSLLVYGGEYDGSITAPSWINPGADILTVLNNLSNELLSKLVESANVIGATAVNNGNASKSGVAMSYEFLGQSYALKETARIAEHFEKMASVMFGLYIGQPIEYTVKYQSNYKPSQDEINKKVELLQKIIDMGISEQITAVMYEELIRDVLGYYKIAKDVEVLIQSIATNSLI